MFEINSLDFSRIFVQLLVSGGIKAGEELRDVIRSMLHTLLAQTGFKLLDEVLSP